MTNEFTKTSSQILELITNSNNILLHCHPYPDPDSIGSVLAFMMAIRKLSKKVTAISGDSKYPESLNELPNHSLLLPKSFSQINQKDFDLFIILDSSSPSQVSQISEVKFDVGLKTIVIDHHKTNQKFGDLNLIVPECSSTSEIIYELFNLWKVEIDSDMAICLFLGIYADTGGFKYLNTTPHTIKIASELAAINPEYHKIVFEYGNSKKPIEIEMMGLALSTIEKYFSNKIAVSAIKLSEIVSRNLSKEDAMEGLIPDTLRSVLGWEIVASLVEAEPNKTTVSLRTRNETKYDVSEIAREVGNNGGGHRGAAGTTIPLPLSQAKESLLDTIAKIYPELGKK